MKKLIIVLVACIVLASCMPTVNPDKVECVPIDSTKIVKADSLSKDTLKDVKQIK